MHTVPETIHTVNFDTALIAAATRATAAHPEAAARIAKGLALVQADAVTDMTLVAQRLFRVRSSADPTVHNDVVSNGETRCTCADFQRHEALCKHGYAVLLVRAARRDMASPALRQAYHLERGEEGTCRFLANGRAVFHPGGHRFHVECDRRALVIRPSVTTRQEGGSPCA